MTSFTDLKAKVYYYEYNGNILAEMLLLSEIPLPALNFLSLEELVFMVYYQFKSLVCWVELIPINLTHMLITTSS